MILKTACLLVFTTLVTLAQAQSSDTAAYVEEPGILGEPQLIEADVGADSLMTAVTVYYRFDGTGEYFDKPMLQSSQAGIYSTFIPTWELTVQQLEFYIVAEASDGTKLSSGSDDMPIVRPLIVSQSAEPIVSTSGAIEQNNALADEQLSNEQSERNTNSLFSGNRKWWAVAAGVLIVGALASASSGGGGGASGGDLPCSGEECELTVVLPDP